MFIVSLLSYTPQHISRETHSLNIHKDVGRTKRECSGAPLLIIKPWSHWKVVRNLWVAEMEVGHGCSCLRTGKGDGRGCSSQEPQGLCPKQWPCSGRRWLYMSLRRLNFKPPHVWSCLWHMKSGGPHFKKHGLGNRGPKTGRTILNAYPLREWSQDNDWGKVFLLVQLGLRVQFILMQKKYILHVQPIIRFIPTRENYCTYSLKKSCLSASQIHQQAMILFLIF